MPKWKSIDQQVCDEEDYAKFEMVYSQIVISTLASY